MLGESITSSYSHSHPHSIILPIRLAVPPSGGQQRRREKNAYKHKSAVKEHQHTQLKRPNG
jgi:hypothetical protein